MFSSILLHILFVVLPPCKYEDSANCSWDAQTAGLANGGRSFFDLGGRVYYMRDDSSRSEGESSDLSTLGSGVLTDGLPR